MAEAYSSFRTRPGALDFVPGHESAGGPPGQHGGMSFLSRWWYRPVPRRRAVLVLVLMLIALVAFLWQAVADSLESTTGVVIAWICVVLLAVDIVRVGAGLVADRYPRD
jgi:hypothetical protein